MNSTRLLQIGQILRWVGILILLAYILHRFTSLSIPLADQYKFAGLGFWAVGTGLMRWIQFRQKSASKE